MNNQHCGLIRGNVTLRYRKLKNTNVDIFLQKRPGKNNYNQIQMADNGSESDVKSNPPGMSEWNVCPDKRSVTEMTTAPGHRAENLKNMFTTSHFQFSFTVCDSNVNSR